MDIDFFWELGSLVNYRNISAAARKLNMSQQTLSKHLAAGEKELGVTLFERKGGSPAMTLTPAGEFVAQRGIEILNQWNKLKIDLPKYTQSVQTVRLSSYEKAAFLGLSSSLQDWAEAQEPRIKVAWATESTDDAFDLVRDGKSDIALEPYDAYGDSSALECTHLFYERATLLVHRNDPLAHMASLPAEGLRGLRLLYMLQPMEIHNACVPHAICNQLGFSPKLESLAYENKLLLYSERLRPGHYALIPESLAPYWHTMLPFTVSVPLKDDHAVFDMCAYCRSDANETVRRVVREAARMEAARGEGTNL